MLTVTSQGILRGKANGQGQHLILQVPNLHYWNVFVDQGNIVYPRSSNTGDIWTVRTDGTSDHALLNTAQQEFAQAVSWPWVIYLDEAGTYTSLNAETHAQFPLGISGDFISLHANRVILTSYSEINSATFTGTDPIVYIGSPDATELLQPAIVAERLVYRRVIWNFRPTTIATGGLFSIPFLGGTTITLDSGPYYVEWAGSIGARVVYHRCPFVSGQASSSCDVASVNIDASAPVALTSDPANEAVQGMVGSQVIIRRNLSGNDQLIAVSVTGGPEKLLMTMTDSEFVQLVVGDLLIVRRPTGTWSLDLNGTLTKLGSVVGDSGFIAVGDAVCVTKVTAVWCMPLDGAGPQVKIADEGRVVGVL